MRSFYELVVCRHGESFDVDEAARLEVEWWRIHRELQREHSGGETRPRRRARGTLQPRLRGPDGRGRPGRRGSARSPCVHSLDEWVEQGCLLDSPLIGDERAALVRSYAALLGAVHRS